jgi:Ni/Co efflux regulator RcnB
MKKTILAGALAAAAFAPMAAQAQDWHDRGDRGHDRREWRDDRRQDRRDDRRDWRQDRREDWQAWREGHRDQYRGGSWNAPFRYRTFGVGVIAPRSYWAPQYYLNDWGSYRLPRPAYGFQRYVRHFNDVLLIDTRSGRVIRVYRNFYW